MVSLEELRQNVGGTLRVGESLAPFSVLGAGGPAEYLVDPPGEEEFLGAAAALRSRGIPIILVRRAGNILVSDRGWRGAALVIDRALGGIRLEPDGSVRAGAGATLAALVGFCLQHALGGAEPMAGLEGTVGGALLRGAFGAEGAALPAKIEILREGVVVTLRAGEPLRGNVVRARPDIVIAARFALKTAGREELHAARRRFLIMHNERRPLNIGDGVLMFRDPPGGSASALIAGAGTRRGAVSPANANMLLHRGAHAPEDVYRIMRAVQLAVRRSSGVTLVPALRPVGFEQEAMKEVA